MCTFVNDRRLNLHEGKREKGRKSFMYNERVVSYVLFILSVFDDRIKLQSTHKHDSLVV